MDVKAHGTQKSSSNEDTKDDSTGIASSGERRTVQNRLAQRVWRRRQALLAKIEIDSLGAAAKQPKYPAEPYQKQGQSIFRLSNKEPEPITEKDGRMKIPTLIRKCGKFDMVLSPDHQLLTVVQNNVLRGLMSNMRALRLTRALISQEDSMSIFVLQPDDHWRSTLVQLPPSLEPSSLQLTIPHHPWIDVLPCSRLRNNLLIALRYMSIDQQTELCEDMVGVGELQVAGHGPGLLLWGDAFCLENWEVSEAMLKKWCEFFTDCSILLKASELRRRHRGF